MGWGYMSPPPWDGTPRDPRPALSPQPLQPIVHIWDSATLLTLQQIGLGSFERGVGSLAFSTAVSPCPPVPLCVSPIPQPSPHPCPPRTKVLTSVWWTTPTST